MSQSNSPLIIGLCLILLLPFNTLAEIERRKDQFGRDFGYYIYPIAGDIPGLGTAQGIGGSVLNMAGGDSDVTGYYIRGDFEATGLAALDLQLIPRRWVLDLAYNDYLVAPIIYNRGLDSNLDDFIQPKAEGQYILGQMTWTYDERRYEAFLRAMDGKERLHEVLGPDGDAFPDVDKSWNHYRNVSIGGSIDLTDDRLDPRDGIRLETNIRLPQDESSDNTEFLALDGNLTYYMPMRRWDTLALNLFGSHAFVTRRGITDYDSVKAEEGLGCDTKPPGSDKDSCIEAETIRINQIVAERKYGTATSLGGTQRLRSFDSYRYFGSKVLFYGVEYRWNLTDERTPFDIYIAKGIRTGIQLAAFIERGSVSDGYRDLLERGRTSYGIGFRVVLSGVIIRFDAADGDEGFQTQLFITYPWSMFSVDNPA